MDSQDRLAVIGVIEEAFQTLGISDRVPIQILLPTISDYVDKNLSDDGLNFDGFYYLFNEEYNVSAEEMQNIVEVAGYIAKSKGIALQKDSANGSVAVLDRPIEPLDLDHHVLLTELQIESPTEEESKVLSLCRIEPRNVMKICMASRMQLNQALDILRNLESKGVIKRAEIAEEAGASEAMPQHSGEVVVQHQSVIKEIGAAKDDKRLDVEKPKQEEAKAGLRGVSIIPFLDPDLDSEGGIKAPERISFSQKSKDTKTVKKGKGSQKAPFSFREFSQNNKLPAVILSVIVIAFAVYWVNSKVMPYFKKAPPLVSLEAENYTVYLPVTKAIKNADVLILEVDSKKWAETSKDSRETSMKSLYDSQKIKGINSILVIDNKGAILGQATPKYINPGR